MDIEFLAEREPHISEHVVYIYRRQSCALRRRVRERVISLVKRQGISSVADVKEPETLPEKLVKSSLFGLSLIICDVEEMKQNTRKEEIDRTIRYIITGVEHRLLLLIPYGSIQTASWSDATNVTVIEEPIITPQTLGAVLSFLMAETKLYDFAKLNERSRFIASFDNFNKGRPMLMSAFIQCFDEVTLKWTPDMGPAVKV